MLNRRELLQLLTSTGLAIPAALLGTESVAGASGATAPPLEHLPLGTVVPSEQRTFCSSETFLLPDQELLGRGLLLVNVQLQLTYKWKDADGQTHEFEMPGRHWVEACFDSLVGPTLRQRDFFECYCDVTKPQHLRISFPAPRDNRDAPLQLAVQLRNCLLAELAGGVTSQDMTVHSQIKLVAAEMRPQPPVVPPA